MRWLMLSLSLISCAYHGPQVQDLLPKGQISLLKGTVASASSGGLKHLVVFGDSLSDTGNLSRNTYGFVIPHEMFFEGRFCNGPIWPDYVEKSLQWTLDDYAVGGALTRKSPFPDSLAVTSLGEQIEKSLDRLKELPPEKTLIALWIGPNNYLRAGSDYQTADGKPKEPLLKAYVGKTIADIKRGLLKLSKLGFYRIALGTMPELGGLNFDPHNGFYPADASLSLFTRLHNEALHRLIDELSDKGQSRPEDKALKIITYKAYEIDHETALNPQAFGFTRTDAPCYLGSLSGKFYGKEEFCKDPMGYKFWEFIHPNTRMQCYYAAQFLDDIARVGLISGYDRSQGISRCLAIKNN